MTYPASNAEGLFPDFAELDQTVKLMEEHQKQIIEDFNRIFRRVCEEAEKSHVSETTEEAAETVQSDTDMPLTQFLAEFGESLFQAVTEQNRPVYHGQTYPELEEVLDGLARPLFTAQREVVRAVLQQLVEEDKPAAIINAEMGTGKTMMSIAAAAAAHRAPWYSARHIWYTNGGAKSSILSLMPVCGSSTEPIHWPSCCKSAPLNENPKYRSFL